MKNRLRKNEKDAIRCQMKGNPVWDLLQNPTRQFEQELSALRLSSEEVFIECFTILDEVKESPKNASFRLQGLWNEEYCDLRDLDINDAEEDELNLGASIIVYSVMLMLSMCDGTYYTKLTMALLEQIGERCGDVFDRLQAAYMPTVWRMGEEKLKTYIKKYMDSEEEWLSDDIAEMLRHVPVMSVVVKGEKLKPQNGAKKVEQLSNRQLVILFEQLLNVPLSSQYTNVKALSDLLSKVSGNSAGSIRQRIIAGIDYDDEQIKQEVQYLITQIEPISTDIAEKMRKNIE